MTRLVLHNMSDHIMHVAIYIFFFARNRRSGGANPLAYEDPGETARLLSRILLEALPT